MLFRSRDKPLRKVIDAALLAAGVHPVRHAVETAEFGLILSSLHRGMGFTCMFHASREEVMQTAGLVEIDFAAELPAAEIRCAVRRGQRGNPVVCRALKMITENLALRD